MYFYPAATVNVKSSPRSYLSLAIRPLKPLLFVVASGLFGMAAHAGQCKFHNDGPNYCSFPAGVTSLNIVVTGAGGGGGQSSRGGAGAVVTQTVSVNGPGMVPTFIGPGGMPGWGGASSSVYGGQTKEIIAGGGGGGGPSGNGGNGNGGDGDNGAGGVGGKGGKNGVGGVGGAGVHVADRDHDTIGSGGNGGDTKFGYGGTGNGGYGGGSNDEGGGGGGGGGGFGGGGGGFGGGGGGGGGSTGGTVTVASNGGAVNDWGGDGSILITWTDPVAPPPPVALIPVMANLPTFAALKFQPQALNLSANSGPAMTKCLMDTVRKIFGADAQFVGQSASGVATISQGGRLIAFYPMEASTSLMDGEGIHLTVFNYLTLGTTCGNFTVSPAIVNVSELAAVFGNMGLQAGIQYDGTIKVSVAGTDYLARPDYVVTRGQPGTPSLVQGADGNYRFTDSAGNIQVLRPAIAVAMDLITDARLALSVITRTMVVQTDGTALLTTDDGKQYLFSPDLTTTQPQTNRDQSITMWQQDRPNHYLFVDGAKMRSQGFTVQRR